ncbi:hypothetical protein [Rhodococcus sp. AG1013]|uniref:hypothetical protein n=1 Tax=unclassified Rhodococcus (in: high G+C Gram-positive bacteria) TaxID=192944 RepID=UPI000E2C55EC|nr:hypothetical protein [Rhodococcus sp. AG1013]RDI23246.1 hypothetical protein DEU38_112110 [Rhodococcus sp. AG1013]
MRRPHAVAEENNWLGEGALTDAEFTEVVEHLRVVLPALLGEQWTDAVFSGDGYVVTESPRSAGGYFRGYRGVRKTAQGYEVMSGDERGSEGLLVTFNRFEDAVKGYAADVISSIRSDHGSAVLRGCGTAQLAASSSAAIELRIPGTRAWCWIGYRWLAGER